MRQCNSLYHCWTSVWHLLWPLCMHISISCTLKPLHRSSDFIACQIALEYFFTQWLENTSRIFKHIIWFLSWQLNQSPNDLEHLWYELPVIFLKDHLRCVIAKFVQKTYMVFIGPQRYPSYMLSSFNQPSLHFFQRRVYWSSSSLVLSDLMLCLIWTFSV